MSEASSTRQHQEIWSLIQIVSYLGRESDAADGKASLQIERDEPGRAGIDGATVQGGEHSRVEGPQASAAVDAGTENGHQTTAVVQMSLLPGPVGEGQQWLVFHRDAVVGHISQGSGNTLARAWQGEKNAVGGDLDAGEDSILRHGSLSVDAGEVQVGPATNLLDGGASDAVALGVLGRSEA